LVPVNEFASFPTTNIFLFHIAQNSTDDLFSIAKQTKISKVNRLTETEILSAHVFDIPDYIQKFDDFWCVRTIQKFVEQTSIWSHQSNNLLNFSKLRPKISAQIKPRENLQLLF